jgi:Domain of unknown function (DUF4232)
VHTARWLAVAAAPLAAATALAAALLTPAAAGASRPGAAASAPACTVADLEVWVAADQSNGAAGTVYYPLEFTNISNHTCTLLGHPGVSAVNSTGHQLGSPATWIKGTAHTVQLAPGATGHAVLSYSNAITSNCPHANQVPAFQLRVIPPDQAKSVHAFWPLVACTASGQTKFMTVQVIVPGIGLMGG